MQVEKEKKLRKYSTISLGTGIVMAFILLQPTMQSAYAVGVEGIPDYDHCPDLDISEDPISMNTVRNKNIVKTIYAEKENFDCFLDQGNLPVRVDVTTFIEIYEDIDDREVIATSAVVTTCIKEPAEGGSGGATVIDCESYVPSTSPVPVGSNCVEIQNITHPQEMNTVTKGKIAKTIETQKEVFVCLLDQLQPNVFNVLKKVEVILFTDIYEDLSTQEVEEVQFHSMRCVVLMKDEQFVERDNDRRDATVESCQFSTINN